MILDQQKENLDAKKYSLFLMYFDCGVHNVLKKLELFLCFCYNYEDNESTKMIRIVEDFIYDIDNHKKIMVRMAWGSSSEDTLTFLDDKGEPYFDEQFEKKYNYIKKLCDRFLYRKQKDLVPESIDILRPNFSNSMVK